MGHNEQKLSGLSPLADQLLYGFYRERFLPAPHERKALPPAPSTFFNGAEVFVGSKIVLLDGRLKSKSETVVELFQDGSFRLSGGLILGGGNECKFSL